MRLNMKKLSISALAILALLISGLLYGENEVDQYIIVRPFSEGQKIQYNNHVQEIARMQRRIESYYDYLERRKNNDCLMFHGGERIYCHYYSIDQNNYTYVPLFASQETVYGRRQRYMYNELAYFKWGADKKIEAFYFETRRGYLGTTRSMSRLIYGNSISDFNGAAVDEKRPPMNLVVNEVLPTGKGRFARYSFPTEAKVFDKPAEEMDIAGRKMNLKTIYLREPEDRLRVVRKYVKLLKRVEMRLQWNVHSGNVRRSAEVERILRDSF